MLKPLITAGCLCAVTAAHADPVRLSGQQIRELIAGATVEINTPLGSKLPVSYTADGQLSGQARDLASYLGSASDTGKWWVASEQLCHKWNRWFNSEPQCMRLRKQGPTIHWLSQNGYSGTATIAVPAPIHIAVIEARMHLAAPEAAATSSMETAMPAPPPEPPKTIDNRPTPPPRSADAPTTQPPSSSSRAASQRQLTAPKRTAAPVYMVANVERDDVLNVRRGPSTEFDVIGKLQPGSRGVLITGECRKQWCPVQQASANGWVNRRYLANDEPLSELADAARSSSMQDLLTANAAQTRPAEPRDPPYAPRTCLTPPALALLERIEERFGPVKLVSTCRPGATIAGTGRPSKHASGNAIDFDAGSRKDQIVEWLIANHHDGGTMTYADMNHIHVDIGPHFVSIAGGQHWASWRDSARQFPARMQRTSGDD
jgi:uncharacterized protein YcbK (DUF882 family)